MRDCISSKMIGSSGKAGGFASVRELTMRTTEQGKPNVKLGAQLRVLHQRLVWAERSGCSPPCNKIEL